MKIRFNLNKILFIVSKKSFISRKTIGKMEIIHCTNIEISFTHGKIPEKKDVYKILLFNRQRKIHKVKLYNNHDLKKKIIQVIIPFII